MMHNLMHVRLHAKNEAMQNKLRFDAHGGPECPGHHARRASGSSTVASPMSHLMCDMQPGGWAPRPSTIAWSVWAGAGCDGHHRFSSVLLFWWSRGVAR